MAQINQENIKKILSGQLMPINEMFSISRRTHAAWGIEGYEVPKEYQDPLRQMEEREFIKNANKKGRKSKKYLTRKGHFLQDLEKTYGKFPAPNAYKTEYKWLEAKPKIKQAKKNLPKNKGTFLDAINNEYTLKNFPIPGPGTYNLRKDEKQIEKELKESKKVKTAANERPNFLCEYEFMSSTTPGPGNYHPRQIKTKLHLNNTEPKDWIKKFNETSKKQKEKKSEQNITPLPTMYMTFSKLAEIKKAEEKDKSKRPERLWGTATRFMDPKKKSKSTSVINIPGPGTYDMISYWNDPKVAYRKKSEKPDKKDWQLKISKGFERSIYY